MRLSVSTWSFHWALRKKKLTLPDCVEKASKFQIDAIEILDIHFNSTAKRSLTKIRKVCKDRGISISALDVSNDFGLPTNRQRVHSRDQVLKWIDVCAELDCRALRVFSGWPALGNPLAYKGEREKLWPEMIQHFKRCCVHAETAGRKLLIENHNHGGFARTVDDLLRIKQEVDCKALGIMLNTGDYIVDTPERNGYQALEKLAYHADMVHASLYELDREGRCIRQDYGRILDILTQAGFQGLISVEYEGKPDLEALEKGITFLKSELLRRGILGEGT